MANAHVRSRQIALFVEGDSERGDARRRTLPVFIHKWLDPQLPEGRRVGIMPVKFQGVSNYLDDLAQKVALYLDEHRANFVVGLVDLYGIPPSRVDLSKCANVREKIIAARAYMRALVPQQYRDRFRQHFAVHEVEAWLLAYVHEWPADVRARITRRPPEQVNFNEPPAKFLKRVLGSYKKTTVAMNLFPKIDPQIAVSQCPHLKLFLEDLLRLANLLQ
ncbi:MAG TPA: DUF4276 family protein [Gemmataceae bacterium]|nr:DUF4276 family protein [Gemmataceae bacterium]